MLPTQTLVWFWLMLSLHHWANTRIYKRSFLFCFNLCKEKEHNAYSLLVINVIVNINCQFDELWSHLGDGLLGLPLRDCFNLIKVGRTDHCEWSHSPGLGPGLYNTEKTNWACIFTHNSASWLWSAIWQATPSSCCCDIPTGMDYDLKLGATRNPSCPHCIGQGMLSQQWKKSN